MIQKKFDKWSNRADDDDDDDKDSDADQDDDEDLLVFCHCPSRGQLPPL